MVERKVVSSGELNVWLTGEIHSVAGCEQCELTWKYRLREPEKHGGCNWSSINLRFGENIFPKTSSSRLPSRSSTSLGLIDGSNKPRELVIFDWTLGIDAMPHSGAKEPCSYH